MPANAASETANYAASTRSGPSATAWPSPSVVVVRGRRAGFATLEAIEEIHRPAQVRDHDAAADHQADRERLEQFGAAGPRVLALGDVVADAVVAAQHHRSHQAEQFLGLHVQRAGLVGLGVEREEAADDLVGLGEDAIVHPLAEFGELLDAIVVAAAAHAPASASKGSSFPARC